MKNDLALKSMGKTNHQKSQAYWIELRAKELFIATYPEFSYLISGIAFPTDANVYPVFNYAKVSKSLSRDTLSFLSELIETTYEEARAITEPTLKSTR